MAAWRGQLRGTLQLWDQIIGKIRLVRDAVGLNHSWHVALYGDAAVVSPRADPGRRADVPVSISIFLDPLPLAHCDQRAP